MKYLIIGNSAAGAGAVEGIRTIDRDAEICIISNEPHHIYSRPLISYLLRGKTTEDKMKYRDDRFYEDNNCMLLAQKTATAINAEKKYVALDDGCAVSYDKLLVATGSRAFVPPFDGLDTVGNAHTFMSLDDVKEIERELDAKKKVLIIGAGLIGLKCAEGIRERVGGITVIDLAPRVLSSILDEDGAALVQKHLEENGIAFRLSCSVSRFEGNTAILQNGERIAFDILILAVGVRPNVELLGGIAAIDKGIIINERAETSAVDIFAAGDCTQSIDVSSGQSRIMALLPNAYLQGECAGINMAGGKKVFDRAIPMNAIGFFGLHLITSGNYHGNVYETNCVGGYKKLFFSDNRLNGYILIGSVEKAGIYTKLIREQTPLDAIDFNLVCERPGLMAFTKENRAAMLGGGMQ